MVHQPGGDWHPVCGGQFQLVKVGRLLVASTPPKKKKNMPMLLASLSSRGLFGAILGMSQELRCLVRITSRFTPYLKIVGEITQLLTTAAGF